MSDVTLPAINVQRAWLRSPTFDLWFILGIPVLAIATGLAIVWYPRLFIPILLIDLWFLGYHHVIATYTRLCFDRKSFSETRHLILALLPLVVVFSLAISYVFGLWVIVSIYFYWQWFHYSRQSWGISRIYRGKHQAAHYDDGLLDQAIFYAVPILGILHRSHQDPGKFLFLDLKVMPIAPGLLKVAAIATVVLLALWVYRRFRAWREGRLAVVHTLYMLTHFGIFGAGYLLVADITYGWLIINMWHNAQYILFVWLFNTRRFKDGIDRDAYFLSYISQPGRLWLYIGWCILITGVIYWGVLRTLDVLLFAGLSATVLLYQIVNFHHYIVDATIWKVRKATIRKTLSLQD